MKNKPYWNNLLLKIKFNLFKRFIGCLMLVFLATSLNAQITGKVTDSEGEAIPGVSIQEKGTINGTITKADGTYEITVGENAILVFSFVGMKTQEISVDGSEIINVILNPDLIGLDEVIVVGYGSLRKSDLTGAVASVKEETLDKVASAHPAEALQGRIAGVSIQKRDGGAPGGGMSMKIRGLGTIGNNEPLYIIDGLPGSFYLLNPDDIESIEVLKDAAAAAIYGSRAANGVVLVTTKTGKKGDLKISYNYYHGFSDLTNQMELTNATDYVNIARMVYDNAGQANPAYLSNNYNVDTDWQKEIFRMGSQLNHNLSLSGGGDVATYSVSASYFDQSGTMIGTGFEKIALRAKTNLTKGKFSLGTNISYTESEIEERSLSLRNVYEIVPLISVYDPNQADGYGLADIANNMPSSRNPVGDEHFNDDWNTDQYLTAHVTGGLNLFKELDYKINLGLNNSNRYNFSHNPSYVVDILDPEIYPRISEERSNFRKLMMENILTFSKSFSKHNVKVMAAATQSKEFFRSTGSSVTGYATLYEVDVDGNLVVTEESAGFPDEYYNTLDAGQGGTYTGWGTEYTYTRTAILGRLNYNYDEKYLFQATLRRDGSSRFGSDNRYGLFPSLSAGWRVTEESFLSDVAFLDMLKLRGSWGKLGNEGSLGDYDYQALISTGTNEFYTYSQGTGETHWQGAIATGLQNKTLRWEEIESINVGVDFSVFNSIIGAVNYYDNRTSDMLVLMQPPPSSGLAAQVVNIGEVKNSGVELELGYQTAINKFNINLNGTFATVNNEVLALGYEEQSITGEALNYTEHYPTQTRVGSEIGAYFLYQMDGVFQSMEEVNQHVGVDENGVTNILQPDAEAGDIRFKDANNDGVLDENDMVYSGSGIPNYEYSLNFDFQYIGFDFSLFFYGVGGNKIYNANRYYTERMSNNYNYGQACTDAWTPQNQSNSMPRPVFGDPNQNARASTRFLEDGDYLRLKNIQLGYTFKHDILSKVGATKIRIYASAQNLLTFTKYSGFDPEISRGTTYAGGTKQGVFSTGIDRTLYPISKTYMFGVQVNF